MQLILSEHISLTPIQAFLESESWAFYRGISTGENRNCCINANYGVDKKNEGGFEKEDVLSADILMSMAFIESQFISSLLSELWPDEDVQREYYEVAGVQSNFYYPQYLTLEMLKNKASEDDYLRLAQPDGWIVGEDLLVMIEAKGMREGAAFNYAQLAKEYLIAEQECFARKIQSPRILLLLTDEQKCIINSNFYDFFKESWEQLFKAKNKVWSQQKVDFMKTHLGQRECPAENTIKACFKILTYSELAEYAANYKTKNESSEKLAAMISNTIAWHSDKSGTLPVWSRMLMSLAKAPLYEFYTGGTINEIVCKTEDEFFGEAKISKENKIYKAVQTVRKTVMEHKEKIDLFYDLYCVQKCDQLKGKDSDTARLNFSFFEQQVNDKGINISPEDARKKLKDAFKELNESYQGEFRENGVVKATSDPNVRTLIYFYVRYLLEWKNEIPGYKFFAFDNKKFFKKKQRT